MQNKVFLKRVAERIRFNAIPLLVLLTGMAISFLVFLSMQRSEQQLVRLNFEQEADNRYFALKRELQGYNLSPSFLT